MSEADMQKKQPLPESNQPVPAIPSQPKEAPAAWIDMTDSPFNPPESEAEDWQTVNFPNALSIDEIQGDISKAPESDAMGSESSADAHAPTDAPPSSISTASFPQIAELVALIQQLRQRNNDLTHRVAQLENVLHECQSALQIHAERSRSQESLLAQRTQELSAAQAQTLRQSRELETANLQTHQQKNLISTLTEQLETSQYRLAQIERECTITQGRYAEQSHQLLQSETACRDLRSRLHRQQRHTLQFKAALEKCLEIPDPADKSRPDKPNISVETALKAEFSLDTPHNVQEILETPPFAPKAQPIKPWAAPSPASPAQKGDDKALQVTDSAPLAAPTASQSLEPPPTEPDLPLDVYHGTANDLADSHNLTLVDNPVEEPLWQELAHLIDRATSAVKPSGPTDTKLGIPTDLAAPESPKPPLNVTDRLTNNLVSDAISEVISNLTNNASNKPAPTSETISADQPIWPVPIVYPQQPPKKRQSLAAIDLPTFPRLQ